MHVLFLLSSSLLQSLPISLIVLVILTILGQDIKILSYNVFSLLVFHLPDVQTLLKQISFRYHPTLWRSKYEACATETPLRMLRIKVLQQIEKFTTGIQQGLSLILKLMYFICKELLGLLPKPLYHTVMHIVN
jgi:hypothetical protein